MQRVGPKWPCSFSTMSYTGRDLTAEEHTCAGGGYMDVAVEGVQSMRCTPHEARS